MTLLHCAFWGLFATVVLTTLLVASQGFGFTRMAVPFLLGSMFTPNRDRAKLYGVGMHFLIGVLLPGGTWSCSKSGTEQPGGGAWSSVPFMAPSGSPSS